MRKSFRRYHWLKMKNAPFVLFLILLIWLISPCNPPPKNQQYQHTNPANNYEIKQESKPIFLEDKLDVGIFTLLEVVDGDTIRIAELDKPLRLLCVDTEETFKPYQARQKELAYKEWKAYLALKRKEKKRRPVKYPTPFGDETLDFAIKFFSGVEKVKIERDSLNRVYDFFNRPLCYVLVEKDGRWVNYNVELVRLGYSPYYAKYGYSNRYHDDFINAQTEAMKKKKGIWDPKVRHYDDYDERIKWWNERGDAIKEFELRFGSDRSYFLLQNEADWERLKNYIGKEITIFGTIDRAKIKTKPYKAYVSHKQNLSVILYFGNEEIVPLIKELMEREDYMCFKGVLEYKGGDYMMGLEKKSQILTIGEILKQKEKF